MSSSLKWVLASLTLAAVAGVSSPKGAQQAWKSLSPLGSTSDKSESSRSPASVHLSQAEAVEKDLRFRPTEKKRYAYFYERKIRLSGMSAEPRDLVYHGTFFLDVLRANENGFEARVENHLVEQPKLNSGPMRVKISATGKTMTFLVTPESAHGQEVAIVKDLLAEWDFPLNRDTVGEFEAREQEVSPLRRTKSKIRYLSGANRPEIVSSLHSLRWDPSIGLPAELGGDESTRMKQGGFSLGSESHFHIQWASTQDSPPFDLSALSNATEEQEVTLESVTPGSASRVDSAALMKELLQLDGMPASERLRVFGDLAALMRSHPDAVAESLSLLRSQGAIALGAGSKLFQTIVGALATAGTPQAQAALITIYQDDSCPTSGKGSILSAMTTTQASLVAPTRDFLAGEVQNDSNPDLSHGAAYALGASLQKNSGTDPATVALLSASWSQASTPSDQAAALSAMGNSGKNDYFSVISQEVQNSSADASFRATAVFALRFMSGDASTQLLAASLNDSSPLVRQASLNAMGSAQWSEGFRAPLQSCASTETVPSIQNGCQALLASR